MQSYIRITRCQKCGQIVGFIPRSKYCGSGSDKDDEHRYKIEIVCNSEYYRLKDKHEAYWNSL